MASPASTSTDSSWTHGSSILPPFSQPREKDKGSSHINFDFISFILHLNLCEALHVFALLCIFDLAKILWTISSPRLISSLKHKQLVWPESKAWTLNLRDKHRRSRLKQQSIHVQDFEVSQLFDKMPRWYCLDYFLVCFPESLFHPAEYTLIRNTH